ncbi:MAG: lamin tail domain-containing protein, partial [Akkermansiaceae bacterium]|nr:lamin tail domain-containing protein [Akkermansiaceae bacterium]
DTVELHNGTGQPVDLTGWFLTDDLEKPTKAPLSGTILPGAYQIFSGASVPGLNSRGETLYLYHGPILVDTVAWGPQIPGFTIGRIGPGGKWSLTYPTFGAANQRAGTAPVRDLRINEWLAAFDVRYGSEFVELYNPGDSPAPLGGLWISDSPDQPRRYQVPPLSFIAPRGFVTFRPATESTPDPGDLPFTLDAFREWIVLSDAAGARIDQVPLVCLHPDLTEGRNPDGSDHLETFPL